MFLLIAPDEKIIVFGGEKLNGKGAVKTPLAVLDTNKLPYEWSIPQFTVATLPPALTLHSATLVGNYMIVNFGKIYSLILYRFFFLNLISQLNEFY